jgi:phage antirepressor YoqD-like protein
MNLNVANTAVRRDADGRFSLNDLHEAAGGLKKHGPSYWLATQSAGELAAELRSTGIPVVTLEGRGGGTFVARELVYSYAMWISPAFHLKVIRAYDQLVMAPPVTSMAALADPATLRGLLLDYAGRVEALEAEVLIQQPKVHALERLADAEGTFNVTEAAKLLQVPPRRLFDWMQQHAWVYRRAGGRSWLAYQPRIQSGVLKHKATVIRLEDGTERISDQVLVTAKGLARLADLLSRDHLAWGNRDHLQAMASSSARSVEVAR